VSDDLQSLAELVDRIERTNDEASKVIAETKQLTAKTDDILKQIEKYKNREAAQLSASN
jgi:ABC-type transporter Mla subunit MlaD